jgi:hypothetical protein
MFGKSSSDILDYILETDDFDSEHCVSLLRGTLKKKSAEVVESIEGYYMTKEQKIRAGIVKEHYSFVNGLISKLDEVVDYLVEPYETYISLLCSIPGISRQTAVTVISEIGTDISQFSSSNKLCSWAGLTPGNNQSAGKKKSSYISRAGVYLKPALVEAAHAAVKSTTNDYYKIKYNRIQKRRGKKRAIIAIARMLLTAIYHMLSTGEVWNPKDLSRVEGFQYTPEEKEKHRIIELRKAARLLIQSGVIDSDVLNSDALSSA